MSIYIYSLSRVIISFNVVALFYLCRRIMRMNGEFLKKAIKDAGYTQVSFADKLGVEPNTVWRWIRGDISPSDKRKQKIAELLGIKISQLVSDEESVAKTDKIDRGMSFKNIIPPRNMIMIPVISSEIRPSAGNGNNYGYSDLEWTVVDTIPLADGEIAAFYSADNAFDCFLDRNKTVRSENHCQAADKRGAAVVFTFHSFQKTVDLIAACSAAVFFSVSGRVNSGGAAETKNR